MTKLTIQIPCFNEAAALPVTLSELPRALPGIDLIEFVVIDDGSTDDTAEVARRLGVHHVVGFRKNQGLAKTFMLGLQTCLEHGADIIVNTDADNQYCGADIVKLIQPILEGKADIVIGARPIEEIQHFSLSKKLLQRFGSWVVRAVSGTSVADAPSGFRAMTREAAMALNVFSEYTYTLETIVQAGQKNMSIVSVPIRVNGFLRPSRLVKSTLSYVRRSIFTLLRIFIVYRPLKFFMTTGVVIFVSGFLIGVRFLVFWFRGGSGGHIQSLILACVLMLIGFQTALLALVADLLSVNRRLLEDVQRNQRAQLPKAIESQPQRRKAVEPADSPRPRGASPPFGSA
ncbi:MAG TPA: glycosyltransferase family 2 protein [Polyangiaceae bacterium]